MRVGERERKRREMQENEKARDERLIAGKGQREVMYMQREMGGEIDCRNKSGIEGNGRSRTGWWWLVKERQRKKG